ncbi:MAG TPA: Fe-S protein assembly co-chaperone HscB, partial [Myxococcaceae bacterium]|nr:Fe-S protein assembly co-chaperone HscB [Myxococcaceae bacterium]
MERAPGLTYFDAFGLPPRFALDPLTLEGGFRERSLQFHPDRFAQGSPKERRLALEHSTALNEAYKTLKDPARRAFYLLKLRGIDLGREDAGTQQGMPPAFLKE